MNRVISDSYYTFGFICIPLFVMVSGALLLKKDESYSLFFKKRIKRIAIPFVAWIAIFTLWKIYYVNDGLSLVQWIKDFAIGVPYYHLWFLYMIAGLYLLTPLLRNWLKNISPKDTQYFLFAWFIIFVFIPSVYYVLEYGFGITPLFPFWKVGEGFVWEMGRYTGFYVLGLVLVNRQFSNKSLIIFGILFVFSSLSTAIIYYWISLVRNGWTWPGWSFITITAAAIPAFILLTRLDRFHNLTQNFRLRKAISTISNATFGIYLVHPIFIELLQNGNFGFTLSGSSFFSFFAIPVTAVAVFVLSALFSFIIGHVPLLKYLVK